MMQRIVFILAVFLSLSACTTLEKVSDVDAQVAGTLASKDRVTLRRIDGREDTVTITRVGQDTMTVRYDDGKTEERSYTAVDSIEYSRADALANTLLLGATLAFFSLGLTGYIEENTVLFPATS